MTSIKFMGRLLSAFPIVLLVGCTSDLDKLQEASKQHQSCLINRTFWLECENLKAEIENSRLAAVKTGKEWSQIDASIILGQRSVVGSEKDSPREQFKIALGKASHIIANESAKAFLTKHPDEVNANLKIAQAALESAKQKESTFCKKRNSAKLTQGQLYADKFSADTKLRVAGILFDGVSRFAEGKSNYKWEQVEREYKAGTIPESDIMSYNAQEAIEITKSKQTLPSDKAVARLITNDTEFKEIRKSVGNEEEKVTTCNAAEVSVAFAKFRLEDAVAASKGIETIYSFEKIIHKAGDSGYELDNISEKKLLELVCLKNTKPNLSKSCVTFNSITKS